MSENIWGYRPAAGHVTGSNLAGYKVEATDGSIGKVDKHSDEVDASYLVVDTGVWIFGKHVLLPAGTITRVDAAEEKVYLDLTKEQIKDAPEFDKEKHLTDPAHREQTGEYYGRHRRV
ncbi:PRC-barrel domain-containing protein [uncultured Streptomyces sp.]|uniref:PRC-barrel domain-containing protein n=1 Tax=uncultured Streptomyces sp. TaxID=174707 RepID=UPI00262248F5|nr:PRC-barrel domain-containing protein [uncultured Streptomyces sp.]